MIKKYSIYFAVLAAVIVFGEGLYVNLTFENLILRTVIAFAGFYVLGNLLGVITIEALLENQLQKIDKRRARKRQAAQTATPAETKEPE